MNSNIGNIENDRLYGLTEIETILGVSHRTLLRWVASGDFPAYKLGGRWKITGSSLNQYLEDRLHHPRKKR